MGVLDMNKQQKQAFEALSKRIVDEADVARLDSFLQGKDIKEYTSNSCMNEDFVIFELAKKLKEKGFKEKCIATYDIEDGEFDFNNYVIRVAYKMNVTAKDCLQLFNNTNTGLIDAPTISQVLKWLREEKKIFVEIVITPMGLYKPMIYDIEGFKKPYRDISPQINFNEAAIAGIEYVIDNLI